MTRNQLEYWKNTETERHNKALEAQGLQSLAIQQRANEIQASNVAEMARSNRERELETHRANLAREANEVLRLNETIRSNQANEAIGRTNAMANVMHAQAAQANAAETQRHNLETEKYLPYSNPWTTLSSTVSTIMDNLTNPKPGNILLAWADEKKKQINDFVTNVLPSNYSYVPNLQKPALNALKKVDSRLNIASNLQKVGTSLGITQQKATTVARPATTRNYKGGKVR